MKKKPAKQVKGRLLRNINSLLEALRWTPWKRKQQKIDVDSLGKRIANIKRKVRSLR